MLQLSALSQPRTTSCPSAGMELQLLLFNSVA